MAKHIIYALPYIDISAVAVNAGLQFPNLSANAFFCPKSLYMKIFWNNRKVLKDLTDFSNNRL